MAERDRVLEYAPRDPAGVSPVWKYCWIAEGVLFCLTLACMLDTDLNGGFWGIEGRVADLIGVLLLGTGTAVSALLLVVGPRWRWAAFLLLAFPYRD